MSSLETITHFNVYDNLYKKHYGKYLQAYRPTKDHDLELYINQLIKPQIDETILDCGSGFGAVAEQVSHQSKKVYAINICKNQIPLNESKVTYIHSDFDRMDFIFKNEQVFDKIIFMESLGYSKNTDILLRKCKNLLKTKGKLILKEFFSKNLFNKKLKDLQLRSISLTKKIYNYQILDNNNIQNILNSLDLKTLSIQHPHFECDWSNSFHFEQSIINNQNLKVMHKESQKDNLFDCLEIIAEKS